MMSKDLLVKQATYKREKNCNHHFLNGVHIFELIILLIKDLFN